VLTMSNDVIAVVCDGPGPDWQRTAIVQNRKVFFPGAVFFSCDKAAFLCACFDGVETITNEGRIFLDSEFLAKEFCNQKDEIELAAKRIFEKAVRAERLGSPSRRDDLSVGKTHRSPTLVHPIVRLYSEFQLSCLPVESRTTATDDRS
jgi:hypothetical protein